MYKLAPLLLSLAAVSQAHAQSNLVDYALANGTANSGQAPVVVNTANRGGLTLYATRAEFDAVIAPAAQSCEDFEDGNINDGDIVGFPAPLNSATDNAVFPAGTIVAGLDIQDDPLNDAGGGGPDGLVAVGATAFGTPSDIVLANTFVDSLNLNFAGGVEGVAFDAFSFTGGGTVAVDFFDGTDSLIGSLMVAADPVNSGFVGATSAIPIARVNISSVGPGPTDEAEGADNICFSSGMVLPPPQAVPALSTYGLYLLALALLGLAGFGLRRSMLSR